MTKKNLRNLGLIYFSGEMDSDLISRCKAAIMLSQETLLVKRYYVAIMSYLKIYEYS